jgi:hypothetical protein
MTFHDRRPPVRRPRRSNIPKDFRRLLDTADTAHEPSRNERLYEQAIELNADMLRDDETKARDYSSKIALANVFLRPFGVQFIVNESVLHIHEEWNGAIGAAWLDDGPAGGVLRHLKSLALDRGAPVPRPGQRHRLGLSLTDTHGGATSQEKRLATRSKEKLNARIMTMRDADPAIVATGEAYECERFRLEVFFPGINKTAWEAIVEAKTDKKGRVVDVGSRGPASNCFRYSNPTLTAINDELRRSAQTLAEIARVIDVVISRLATDRAALSEEMPARKSDLPRYYITKRAFLFQQVKQSAPDASNVFDRTGAGRDDCTAILNPFGLGASDDKKAGGGSAGRALRRELKLEGKKAKVIDITDRWCGGRQSYADAHLRSIEKRPINPEHDWGNAFFEKPDYPRGITGYPKSINGGLALCSK